MSTPNFIIVGNNSLTGVNSFHGMKTCGVLTTNLNRALMSEGTSLSAPDFAIGAGWGTGALASMAHGVDGAFQLTITAGTSPVVGATFTLTYHDGSWGSAPIVFAEQVGGTGSISDMSVSSASGSIVITYNGLPIAGDTYVFDIISFGRS